MIKNIFPPVSICYEINVRLLGARLGARLADRGGTDLRCGSARAGRGGAELPRAGQSTPLSRAPTSHTVAMLDCPPQLSAHCAGPHSVQPGTGE